MSFFLRKEDKDGEKRQGNALRGNHTGENKRTIIKLSTTIVDDDEEDVFYYCNGIESLKSLTEYSPFHTFIITDCWKFF